MSVFSLLPLIIFLFYAALIVFAIWYLLKYLKVQSERNDILKDIANKLNKKGD